MDLFLHIISHISDEVIFAVKIAHLMLLNKAYLFSFQHAEFP